MRRLIFALVLIWPVPALATDYTLIVQNAVESHILPGFEALADQTARLADAAADDCTARSDALRSAYNDAFDAWIRVSHLRFGPTEQDDRAFALAYWPDSKGFTPRTLSGLIQNEDPAGQDPAQYAHVSIAARGFYALEFLLYDDQISALGSDAYRCALIRTVTQDIRGNATAILADWRGHYANYLLGPGAGGSPYRTAQEAAQELYKALVAGLRFTSDTRLGRPLGTFEHPRPTRAETWRSDRSLRNVILSLESTGNLAAILASGNNEIAADFNNAYGRAFDLASDLGDPVLGGVSDPVGRLRVEILQQAVNHISDISGTELGPYLGLATGFNALDGD